MPICPLCNGTKYDFKKDKNSGYFVECKKCHGTGIIEEQTNEEWFCGLSTEEKAKVITDFIKRIAKAEEIELNINKEAWIRWLKQPHKEEKHE